LAQIQGSGLLIVFSLPYDVGVRLYFGMQKLKLSSSWRMMIAMRLELNQSRAGAKPCASTLPTAAMWPF
jgi:hypothetical protein